MRTYGIEEVCRSILADDRTHEFVVAYKQYLADSSEAGFWREMKRLSGKDVDIDRLSKYGPNELLYRLIDSSRDRPEFSQLRPLHDATLEKYRIKVK